MMDIRKLQWTLPPFLYFFCLIVMITAGLKVYRLDRQIDAIRATYDKQLGDLQTTINEQTKEISNCRKTVIGDGTATILMDVNHPYGKFVSPAAQLPAGYIPGPVWIVPRRIVPRTMDGTLNGAYAYLHSDGTMEPWRTAGESK
jgi:hypothetical protein